MLFGIIGTIDRGNFVFDRWPRSKEIPKVRGFVTAGELSEKLAQQFYYFGVFRKSKVFETEAASFSESCFIQIFNANQKRMQVVLGIDDECVIVSRSVFISKNENIFCQSSAAPTNSNLFVFEDLQEDKKNVVNSITLAWRAEKFDQANTLKNKLSLMAGTLKRMEQSSDYLSKQIIKITEAKNIFEKKIKQKCLQLNKDISLQLEEFKVKEIFQEFYDLAEESIKDIEIFSQMNKFYQSCSQDLGQNSGSPGWAAPHTTNYHVPLSQVASNYKKVYEVAGEASQWQTNQTSFMGKKQKQMEQIVLKTTLATSRKLQLLPESFRDQRIDIIYNSVLSSNDSSLEQIVAKSKSLSLNEAIQTINFLKVNQIGVNVYPFDLKKYYNLYALKKMPSWPLIKKFDTKIFPQESILKQIHSFGKFKRISALNEKLKYTILQGLIKEVKVYIYYLDSLFPTQQGKKVAHFKVEDEDQQDDESQKFAHYPIKIPNNSKLGSIQQEVEKLNLLNNFINKGINLNEILRQEPIFGKISEILKLVIGKMERKNSPREQGPLDEDQSEYKKPMWGFYYVEEP